MVDLLTELQQLQFMTPQEILKGLLYLNPHPKKIFDEEKLYEGLREASKYCRELKRFFRTSGDGTGPEPSSSLEKGLDFMLMGKIIQDVGDFQRSYLTKDGKESVEEELSRAYGENIFHALEPVAKLVWDSVRLLQ